MLAFFRGAVVLIRRLSYAVLAVCLFLASAAIGAAFRDAHPNEDWKARVWDLVRLSADRVVATAGDLSHLAGDLTQFASDIRGKSGEKKVAAKKPVQPAVLPASAAVDPQTDAEKDENGRADEPAPGMRAVSLTQSEVTEPVHDPLRWLSDGSDCAGVRAGMKERYGDAQRPADIADEILREEFRHVAAETCSPSRNASCRFEWCNGLNQAGPAALEEDEAADGDDGLRRAQLESVHPTSSTTGAVAAPSVVATTRIGAPARSAHVFRAESAANTAQRVSRPVTMVVASAARPKTLNGIVLDKDPPPVPKPDALDTPEAPRPVLGRLNFPKEAKDEPDEYLMVLRKGASARNALTRSEGQ